MNRNMFSSHLFVQLMVTPSLVTLRLASAPLSVCVWPSTLRQRDHQQETKYPSYFHRKSPVPIFGKYREMTKLVSIHSKLSSVLCSS